MADEFALRVPEGLTRKGHELAVLRDQYYRELYASGRWKHYGTEAEVKAKLEETAAEVAKWQTMLARIADASEAAPEAKA